MSQRYAEFILIVLVFLCLVGPAHAEQVTITGQVLGPEGQPVAAAGVFVLYRSTKDQWPFAVKQRQSDADGRFSFSFDTHEPDRVVQGGARKEGFALDWGRVEAGGEITLKLSANAVTCRGTLTDAQGNPIGGAEVAIGILQRLGANGTWQHLVFGEAKLLRDMTDEAGRFELLGLPQEAGLSLVAQAEGWATRVIGNVMPPAIFAREQDIELILHPEAVVSGRITREGEPVSGVEIFCQGQDPTSGWNEDMSAQDGTYKLDQLPAGVYNVMVDPPEGLTAEAIEGVTLKAGEHVTDADLELTPGGLVQGAVTEAETGRPIAGARVAAYGPARPHSSAACQSVTTNEAGTYTFRLPVGKNMLYYMGGVEGLPHTSAEPDKQWVEVVAGEIMTGVDFVLRRVHNLRGQILLPDGRPAAGVSVGAIAGTFTRERLESFFGTQSDTEGKFELDLAKTFRPEPPWAVFACDLDRDLAEIVFVYDSEKPVEIRLAQAAYAVAEVIDTEGKPVPDIGVRVWVTYDGVSGRDIPGARSDEQGRLRVGPLPAGVRLKVLPTSETDQLVVDSAWWNLGQITLAPGEQRQLPPLRLDLKGRSARGWVGDQQQQAVQGALVFGVGERGFGATKEPAYAGEDGYFELTGLPARGKVLIVAVHATKPLFAAEEIDPDWGFEPGLILQPLGSATGRVVDEQGKPVRGATVSVSGGLSYWQSSQLRQRLTSAGFKWQAYTDEEGRWDVAGLIAGVNYEVPVFPPEKRGGRTLAEFTAKGGQTVDLGEMVLKQTEE